MLTDETLVLPFLRMLMLVTDGVGIFASYTIAQYYKPYPMAQAGWRRWASWKTIRSSPIFLLYVFFYALAGVFLALTISDALVIAKAPQSWATLPIIRGLVFRLPLAIVELWIIHRQHAR